MMNNDYLITTDSGCDLQSDTCEKLNVIPLKMKYSMNGELCDDDMTEESCKKFFDKMKNGATAVTSQINPTEFVDLWTPLLDEKKPIVHISLGGGISGSYKNAVIAAQALKESYPDSKIYVINSTQASAGYGLMVSLAADMRDKGNTAEECADWLNNNKKGINAWYTTSDLTYLHKGGRVSKTGAILADILNINPILDLDAEGHLKVAEKIRGQKRTDDRMVSIAREYGIDNKSQTIFISHADAYDKAKELGERMVKEAGFGSYFISYIGAIIGAHTGPGLVAMFFRGKDRK